MTVEMMKSETDGQLYDDGGVLMLWKRWWCQLMMKPGNDAVGQLCYGVAMLLHAWRKCLRSIASEADWWSEHLGNSVDSGGLRLSNVLMAIGAMYCANG